MVLPTQNLDEHEMSKVCRSLGEHHIACCYVQEPDILVCDVAESPQAISIVPSLSSCSRAVTGSSFFGISPQVFEMMKCITWSPYT